jgi:GTPase SAR1 family protein
VRYIEASAKDGTNVSRIFEQLAQDISHQVSPDSVALMKKNSELSRKSLDRKQERSCDC